MHRFFEKYRLDRLYLAMDKNIYISSLRHGLSLSIPFFLFGSMALVLVNLPIDVYQEFLWSAMDGMLIDILMWMFYASMGLLSFIILISVSYSFGKLADESRSGVYPLTCMISFVIFIMDENYSIEFYMMGTNWMFTAILITLLCCAVLRSLLQVSTHWHDRHYHEGVDLDFQNVMVSLVPIAVCITFFALLKMVVVGIIGSVDIQNVGSALFTALFEKVGTGFGGSFLFIFLIHILWFFGIHGSNMMNMVSIDMFEAGMETNVAAVAAGEAAPVLFTKTFFDCFILMGGSGATLCLLIAMLIGNKKDDSKGLFKYSIIPSIFNINELVLFGLPVVFNPIMLIPYLIVPHVLLCTSSAAMSLDLVPYCSQQVKWTTPIIFSGFQSTGSWTGAILQIVNLAIGAAIYLPFIKVSEKYYSGLLKKNAAELRDAIMEREETGNTTSLHSSVYHRLHDVVKLMTSDLRYALNNRKVSLFYQPQFDIDGNLYGVEALLRWNHPNLGFQYPPMVIELAREDGFLQKMGYQIIETAASALERLSQEVKYPFDLAVNISPVQLEDPRFCDTVKAILDKHDFHGSTLCFEITEQIALSSTNAIQDRIACLHEMGIPFHMDDFGMGHSSIIYLQDNDFDAVKLDGSLIRQMMRNPRAQDIIGGIHQMSESLHYDLIAEFVETEEQRDKLNELGCRIYQGYLYSPALPLPELEKYLEKNHALKKMLNTEHTPEELYL